MPRVASAVDSLGFDTDSKISTFMAKQAYAAGYRFVVRYVGLTLAQVAGDIDSDEIKGIIDAGLALMLVQHARYPGWVPSQDLGRLDGSVASQLATRVGYVTGAHLWLDAEGIAPSTPVKFIAEYIEGWCAVVRPAYAPGLYVGSNVILTSGQLWNLSVNRYWSDFGPRDVDNRGFCMKQLLGNVSAFGTKIDPDWLHGDSYGSRPNWMVGD